MKRLKPYTLITPAVVALVLCADQISKYAVQARLEPGQSWDVVPWLASVFRFTYVTNTGVAFGMFKQLGNVFVAIELIVIIAIMIYYRGIPAGNAPLRIALGLQLGGATGNLVDRLRQGFVLDFFDLSFWPLHEFPVFNVADASIVTGVALLVLLLLWEEKVERDRRRRGSDEHGGAKAAPQGPPAPSLEESS